MCGHVSADGVNELRQEGEEKERGLGIEDVYDDSLGEDAAESGSWGVGRSVEGFITAEFLDAEIDEIGGAEIFDHAEGGGRRNEQSGEADGGGRGVDQGAYADAQSGDESAIAAVADAAAEDVEDGRAGYGEQECRGTDENQECRVAREHDRGLGGGEQEGFVLGDDDGVLVVCREAAVGSADGPAVVVERDVAGARGDDGLDGDDQALG